MLHEGQFRKVAVSGLLRLHGQERLSYCQSQVLFTCYAEIMNLPSTADVAFANEPASLSMFFAGLTQQKV